MKRKLEIALLIVYSVLWLVSSIWAGDKWYVPALVGAVIFLVYAIKTVEREFDRV